MNAAKALPLFRLKRITSAGVIDSTVRYSSATLATEELSFTEAKPFEQIPGFKSLPFIGTSWVFYPIIGKYKHEEAHIYDKDRYKLFGNISRDVFSSHNIISIYDRNDIEAVVRNESNQPSRGVLSTMLKYREEKRELFKSLGLILTQGKEWYDFRFKMQPHLMKPRSVDRYIGSITDVAQDMVNHITRIRGNNYEVEDTMNELFKWSLETIALVALNSRLGCLDLNAPPDSDGRKLIDAVQTSFDMINKIEALTGSSIQLWKYFKTPAWRKFCNAMDISAEISFKHAKKAMDAIKSGNVSTEEPTLMQEMLSSKDIKPHEIMTMVVDMLMAGIDTTSNGTGYLLYHLAKNPDKQEKLYQEICQILPSPSEKLTAEKLSNLRYLKLCLKEALRLHPVVRGIGRLTERDLVLSGYQVPAGTLVLALLPVCGRMEENFKNADKFIPERWSASREEKPSPYLFLPFGFGTRSCVGRRIAELEMWTLVTEIIRNFRVEYHYEDFQIKNRIINIPDRPLKFAFIDRK